MRATLNEIFNPVAFGFGWIVLAAAMEWLFPQHPDWADAAFFVWLFGAVLMPFEQKSKKA
jgi:hypothetical protein